MRLVPSDPAAALVSPTARRRRGEMSLDPSPHASLGDLLGDALITFKRETALVETNRKREAARLSYRDVRWRAFALARELERRGVGAGDRVAILLSNQPLWPIAGTAAFHRGAVLVPLDHKLGADDQAALLAHARPTVLITEYPIWRALAGHLGNGASVPHVWVAGAPDGAELGGADRIEAFAPWAPDAPEPRRVPRARDDVATVVYSSGTGGRPKGCLLTHDNYLAQYDALRLRFPLVTGDRYFSVLPTNHAIDFMCGFVGAFAGGATVVHQRALRPEFLAWTMKHARVTHMAVVPLLLEALARRVREQVDARPPLVRGALEALGALNRELTARAPRHALSRRLLAPVHDGFGGELRLLFAGGAFVPPELADFFYDLGIPVAIGYGLTEACTVITVNDLRPFRADSVGAPVDGVEVRVAEPGADGVGEVQVRGRTVFRGYLGDPTLTAEAFTDDGWLRTGDLGWLDAANHLHLVGRAKNMVVTPGGKNVYPEDVEAAFRDVPCEELAVYARSYLLGDVTLAEDALVAVVQPGPEHDRDAIVEAVRRTNHGLPEHKRIRAVAFHDGELPRTASMKLKRPVLAERVRAAAPGLVEVTS